MIILDDQAHQSDVMYRICPYRSRGQEDKSLIEAGPE